MSSILDPALMGGAAGAPGIQGVDPSAAGPAPADLAGALGAPPAAGPPGLPGLPPDLSALGDTEEPAGPTVEDTDDPDGLAGIALAALRKILAGDAETDHEDQLIIEKATTQIQQYLAGNQKLNDTAMGAGPGEKYVRKSASRGAGGGY